ncbi:MAG: hypothetical protein J0L73_02390 [Verrucomicrobia bacterium]|nr:hypothetical protein [Verrucomicrobiota bacterium]
MNLTQQPTEWNLLEETEAPGDSREGVGDLVRKAAQQIARFSNAMVGVFMPRAPGSSLRVTWAGVLRADCDRLIPEASEEVRFQVANQMFLREEGKPLVFDDTWSVETWDQMNGYRVVFLTDSAGARRETLGRRMQKFFKRLVRMI